jgi:PilZ domain
MQAQGQQRRLRERLEIPLPVRVHCRESADHGWVEKTRLIDITPFGARLALGRPTEPGRLLHLTMPLPRQLRSFDYTAEQYNIWALVRHARALTTEEGEEGRAPRFIVGVAFVGKHPPLSFEADPAQRFQISSAPADEKLWSLSELPDTETVRAGERRTEPRRALRTEVVIEVYDAEGNISAREVTLTENISRRGMSAVTGLDIVRGRYVRVRSARYHIAVVAAVRRLRRGTDGLKRLHLEFVDQQWPTPEAG